MLTSIIRDRNNNMWIGSYNGLFKHEGSRIRSFNNIGTGSKSISGGEMHSVFEDRQGYIWIGTTNGLDKIDPVTYHIEHYPLRSSDTASSFVGYIYSVFQDKEDFIWASTDAAMFRMNYHTGKYITIPERKDKSGMASIHTSYKSGISTDKGLWMHTLNGMVFYEYATRHFYHRYYNPENKAIFKLSETDKPGNQSNLILDKKNNLWFVSYDKILMRYNIKTEQLDTFAFNRPPSAWFCCYSLAVDDKENVWIGFRHGGLLVFNQHTNRFTSITGGTPNSLIKSNYIYSLAVDYQGQMWVSTDNGLDIINLYNSAIRQIYLSAEKDFTNLKYQMGTPSTDGHSIINIPFYKFGFLQVSIGTDSIRPFQLSQDIFAGTTYIIPGKNKMIWAARNKKLIPFDVSKSKIISSSEKPPLPDSISKYPGDVVWHYQSGNDLIFKKNNGVIYYLHANKKVELLEGYGFKKNICISADSGFLWYVNKELNLVKRNLSTHNSQTIHLQKNLKSLNFSFSNPRDIADDGEYIWITSQNGLLRFHQASGKLIPYTVENGLAHSFTFSLCVDLKKEYGWGH